MTAVTIAFSPQGKALFSSACAENENIKYIGNFSSGADCFNNTQIPQTEFVFVDAQASDGVSAVKKMRAANGGAVVMVALDKAEQAVPYIKYNVDFFLLKPYTRVDIAALIKRALLLHSAQNKRVKIVTFGQFEVFIDGKPTNFGGKKVKELFALLVDKNGKTLKTEEAFSRLWENDSYTHKNANKCRKLWGRLQAFLAEKDLSDLINNENGQKSLNCSLVDCDYFSFLSGDMSAVNKFAFSYMSDYSWAEYTLADLTEIKYNAKNV